VAEVLSSPFLLVALEVAALYGIYRPRDGLKLQQSIQILLYDKCSWGLDPEVRLEPLPEDYKP
jgi:hypothetical protein